MTEQTNNTDRRKIDFLKTVNVAKQGTLSQQHQEYLGFQIKRSNKNRNISTDVPN